MHAERDLLRARPELARAKVFIHFESSVERLDVVELWGVLGERNTWQAVPTSILRRIMHRMLGLPLERPAEQGGRIRRMAQQDGADMPCTSEIVTVAESTANQQRLQPQRWEVRRPAEGDLSCSNGSSSPQTGASGDSPCDETTHVHDQGNGQSHPWPSDSSSLTNGRVLVDDGRGADDNSDPCCGEELAEAPDAVPCEACLERLAAAAAARSEAVDSQLTVTVSGGTVSR